jgi:hypothetical protein
MSARHCDPATGCAVPAQPASLRRSTSVVCLRCYTSAERHAWSFCDHCGEPLGPWSTTGHAVPLIHRREALLREVRARGGGKDE